MGRAGIEPATHGFSAHQVSDHNSLEDAEVKNRGNAGAALALHSASDLQFIIDCWPALAADARAAVVSLVRECLSLLPKTAAKQIAGSG